MKKGLTPMGLRQAEVESYLWAGCSMFPFVQIITDMQLGGVAFYRTGSSPAGLASGSTGKKMSAFRLDKKQQAIRTTRTLLATLSLSAVASHIC